MADGYALIEINKEGEARLKELSYFDFRLEDVCFDDCEGTDQLVSQLPEGIKDSLVMIIFDYVCDCSRDYWGEWDCEELFNLVSHTVVKEGYKEFYRQMVTEELNIGIGGFENLNCIPENEITLQDKNYYKNLVAEWEEFYNEDFQPYKNEPKKINGVTDLWDLIN